MLMKYLEGNPLSKAEADTLGVQYSSPSMLPKILGAKLTKSIVNDQHGDIQLIMTVLTASRALKLGKNPDWTTITNPPTFKGDQGAQGNSNVADGRTPSLEKDLGRLSYAELVLDMARHVSSF